MPTTIKQADLIESIAAALQYISQVRNWQKRWSKRWRPAYRSVC